MGNNCYGTFSISEPLGLSELLKISMPQETEGFSQEPETDPNEEWLDSLGMNGLAN